MAITIQSKQPGFRRCGMAHSTEQVAYQDDRFSEEDLAILEAEPMLIVTRTKSEPQPVPLADLVDAIAKMDKDNPSLWTKSGTPTTDALSEAVGYAVNAQQRDAAWQTYEEVPN